MDVVAQEQSAAYDDKVLQHEALGGLGLLLSLDARARRLRVPRLARGSSTSYAVDRAEL